jgi:predicted O-methyltransferase YrrM
MTIIDKQEVKDFLEANKNADSFDLAQKLNQKNFSVPILDLLELLRLYQKARIKIPFWTENYCMLSKTAFEQSTAQRVAEWKSTLFSGESALVLAGGLGVDDWAFAQNFITVTSLDSDATLNQMVQDNYKKLGLTNCERLDADVYTFVEEHHKTYDLIYIDPDRRNSDKRVFKLEETEPNIFKLLPRLMLMSDQILVKSSPMLDVSYLQQTFTNLAKVWVIALYGEVKEVLFLLQKQSTDCELEAIDIGVDFIQSVSSSRPNKAPNAIHSATNIVYLPNAPLIKSGLCRYYAENLSLQSLSKNGLVLKGNLIFDHFMGRQFAIIAEMPYNLKQFLAYLKDYNIKKANVIKKEFPYEVAAIRKLFKLDNGGTDYLIFYNDAAKKSYLIHAVLIKKNVPLQ